MTAISGSDPAPVPPTRISLAALGISLSSFFALTYVVCFLLALLLPAPVLSAWLTLSGATAVPDWWGLAEGLVFSVVCGWYVALVFGTIYNYFAAKFS